MNHQAILLALTLGASSNLLTAQDRNPSPQGQRPPRHEAGPGAPGGFHLLPPPVQAQLNLSAEQQRLLVALEAETKAKLEKILTPEQANQLEQARPPQQPPGHPGGRGAQGAPSGILTARDGNPPPHEQRPPRHEAGPEASAGSHLLPPSVQAQLNLSAEQQRLLVALEAETKAKLGKILTPEQSLLLQQVRPSQRPNGSPGARGIGRGPGGVGRPQRPAFE